MEDKYLSVSTCTIPNTYNITMNHKGAECLCDIIEKWEAYANYDEVNLDFETIENTRQMQILKDKLRFLLNGEISTSYSHGNYLIGFIRKTWEDILVCLQYYISYIADKDEEKASYYDWIYSKISEGLKHIDELVGGVA